MIPKPTSRAPLRTRVSYLEEMAAERRELAALCARVAAIEACAVEESREFDRAYDVALKTDQRLTGFIDRTLLRRLRWLLVGR